MTTEPTTQFDVLVIGAGPAGLAAGIAASQRGCSVGLSERNREAGRKFRLSGSGQCNLTHGGSIFDFLKHYGGRKKERFVKPALYSFDNLETVRFFEQRGVALFERKDGKVFPKSLNSDDPLQVLVGEFRQQGGCLRNATRIQSVRKTESGFQVETDHGELSSKNLVLATGGNSYPGTGSQGDGFRFAETFGHRIIKPKPALTPIIVRNFAFAESAGIAFRQSAIELFRDEKRIQRGQGDVLLTHRGLSGPGILDLSRFIEANDEIRLSICSGRSDLTTDLTTDLTKWLIGKKTLKNALSPLDIPERFFVQLLESLDISPDQAAAETSKGERKRIETALVGLPFVVEKLGDWNEAMSTAGGVALDEVDRQTMQSRIVPGLFFCGEVLDVDGDTGGYNIQFALSSGFLAGRKII